MAVALPRRKRPLSCAPTESEYEMMFSEATIVRDGFRAPDSGVEQYLLCYTSARPAVWRVHMRIPHQLR